jgi:hypothetical protein
MTTEINWDAPIPTVRMFGVLLPAMLEEDGLGMRTALGFARQFSEVLARWDQMPWSGPDAGYAKAAEMFRRRQMTGNFDIWDTFALADLCQKAARFTALTNLESGDSEVMAFHEAVSAIEEQWRRDEPGAAPRL